MSQSAIGTLLVEHAASQAYSLSLIQGLDTNQVNWRPNTSSSAIGWHLGHQAAVVHYLVRNLTAAEPSVDVDFDRLFDSATPERERGSLPPLKEILEYRVAINTHRDTILNRIADGAGSSPKQLAVVGKRMLLNLIDHEYQHAKWIEEVRNQFVADRVPGPVSNLVDQTDGYWMIRGI